MMVNLLRYPARLINPHHTPLVVTEYTSFRASLVYSRGEFGPGTFVWFPEGEPMSSARIARMDDMIALFITNKSFRIDYVEIKS